MRQGVSRNTEFVGGTDEVVLAQCFGNEACAEVLIVGMLVLVCSVDAIVVSGAVAPSVGTVASEVFGVFIVPKAHEVASALA